MLEIGNRSGDEAVEGEYQDDAADDAVDEPHRTDVEVSAHLVHKEGDHRPPQQRAQHYRGVADDDVIELEFGQRKTESRKQRNNQEHDERIAQGEQETRGHVSPVVVALVYVLLNLADRVVEYHVHGIDNQDDTADNLQQVNMISYKIGHQRDAQPHQQAVEQIARRSPHSREKARIAALVQRALDTQDANRAHGCR